MKLDPILEEYRARSGPYRTREGEKRGVFYIPAGPSGRSLVAMADDGTNEGRDEPDQLLGWEHVSVSIFTEQARKRGLLPNWNEMDFVKRLFWDDEECVVQFHPPRSRWVSNVPVLHMWRWLGGEFPLPHPLLVGVQAAGEFKSHADAERADAIMKQQVEDMRRGTKA